MSPPPSPLPLRPRICVGPLVLLLLVLTPVALAGPGPVPINSMSGKWWPEWREEEDTSLAAEEVNVTTVEGRTASLPCRVLHLYDKTVSWIRTRDLTVLAVDRTTVTTDARFSVKHPQETGDWILEIRGAQLGDEGTYDCQVNTYPKKSTRVHLRVLSLEGAGVFLEIPASDTRMPPKKLETVLPTPQQHMLTSPRNPLHAPFSKHLITLKIHGERWAEVKEGRALGLNCEARGQNIHEAYASSRAPDSPLIVWTLDEVPVTMLFQDDKVEVFEDWRSDVVVSHLTLYELRVEDSGTFSCHAPHAITQAIPVTVLRRGELSVKTSYQTSFKESFSKVFSERDPPEPMYLKPATELKQMDAAAAVLNIGDALLNEHKPSSSCSSNNTVEVSQICMLVILLFNCAIFVAL